MYFQFIHTCMADLSKAVLHIINIMEKEIMLEYGTDILKQLRVYTLLFKNLIDI